MALRSSVNRHRLGLMRLEIGSSSMALLGQHPPATFGARNLGTMCNSLPAIWVRVMVVLFVSHTTHISLPNESLFTDT